MSEKKEPKKGSPKKPGPQPSFQTTSKPDSKPLSGDKISVDIRNRKVPPKDRPRLLARWQIEQVSQRKLAKEYVVSRATIKNWLENTAEDVGIEIRPAT